MIVEWLVLGFVVAVPLSLYVGGLALLNHVLKKEGPALKALHLSSKQITQCQASKSNGPSSAA